jgi:hypothetical protein
MIFIRLRDLTLHYLLSLSLQFQNFTKGTQCYLDLVLGRLTSGHPLEPKTGLDENLHALPLSLFIGESDDFISEPCDERNEDDPRGHFISE